jgi:hypothetical protein
MAAQLPAAISAVMKALISKEHPKRDRKTHQPGVSRQARSMARGQYENGNDVNCGTRGPGALSPIEETSCSTPSAASITEQARSISEQTNVSGSSSRLADFFSADVFQTVLHNPTTCHQLTKFARTRFCGENMEFLEQVCVQCRLMNQAPSLADQDRLTATMHF